MQFDAAKSEREIILELIQKINELESNTAVATKMAEAKINQALEAFKIEMSETNKNGESKEEPSEGKTIGAVSKLVESKINPYIATLTALIQEIKEQAHADKKESIEAVAGVNTSVAVIAEALTDEASQGDQSSLNTLDYTKLAQLTAQILAKKGLLVQRAQPIKKRSFEWKQYAIIISVISMLGGAFYLYQNRSYDAKIIYKKSEYIAKCNDTKQECYVIQNGKAYALPFKDITEISK